MDFFEKAFQWLAGVSQKLPVVNTKLFLIVTLAVILGVGVVIAFTLFASRARKLYVSSRKIRKYLANIDAVDDDNVSDFTAHCFSKKTPQPLRDAWVQYLGVRFGYPSDIVSDEVYDKFVKKNKDVRSGIFLAISLILLGLFAFWGYGTMRDANMGTVHLLALLLIGVIYLVLILLARKQNQRCLETFEAMQEDLDAKVNLQIESNYATDSSPLQELNALVEEIIARNTAKAIDDDESEQTPIEALIEQKMQEDEDFEEDEQESIDELLNAQEDETLAEEETPVEDESLVEDESPVEEETPAEEVESPVECESDEASEEVAEDNAESEVEGEIEDETAFEDVADEQDDLSDSEDEADNQEGGFEVVEDEQEADEPQTDVEETEDEINESHVDEVAEPQEDEQVELQEESGEDLADGEADAEDESGDEQQDIDNADEVPQDEIAEEESDDENVDAEEQVNEEDFEQTEESDESEIVDETEESGKTEKSEETEESDEIEESEENAEDEESEESEELVEAQEDDEPEVVYVVEGDEDDEENVKPAKLVKLPNLIDYMLSKNMPKAMKIQIATMLITTYNKFKDSPQDRKIVVSCLSKVMRDLQSNK